MEEKFLKAWFEARSQAEQLGVKLRKLDRENAMREAHRTLSGHRDSEGFGHLQRINRLDLSLEALAVKAQFTALFNDEEANNALTRLMDAGYTF